MSRRFLRGITFSILALAVLGLLVTVPPTASALTIYQENMESTPEGDMPPGWGGGGAGGQTLTEVSSFAASEGVLGFRMGSTAPNPYVIDSVRHTIGNYPWQTAGIFHYEFEMAIQAGQIGHWDIALLDFFDAGVQIVWSTALCPVSDYGFIYTIGAGISACQYYAEDTFHKIEFDINSATDRYDITVNDVLISANQPTSNGDLGQLFAAQFDAVATALDTGKFWIVDAIFVSDDRTGGSGGAGIAYEEAEFEEDPCDPNTKTLTFTDTTAPPDSVLVYIWDFDDGTPVLTTQSPTVTHTFPEFGTYTIDYAVALVDGTNYRAQVEVTVGFCVAPLLGDVFSQLATFFVAMGVVLWLTFVLTRRRRIMILALVSTLVGVSGWSLLLSVI